MEFTDRYQALGIDYPDPETMCHGHCEGTGVYPVKLDFRGYDEAEAAAWEHAHWQAHGSLWRRIVTAWQLGTWSMLWERCDGWHFIRCAACNGTGRKP